MHVLCKYPIDVTSDEIGLFDLMLELKWREIAGSCSHKGLSNYFFHILKKYDDGICVYLNKKASAEIDTVLPELCYT